MPIKQVFESAPGVYRTGLRSGPDPWANDSNRDRIYDEYLWWGNGLWIIENPESPANYEIVFFCLNHERSSGAGQGANGVAMRWSGLNGEFLGHDDRIGIGFTDITVGSDGTARAKWNWLGYNHKYYKFDEFIYDFVEVHPSGYYGGGTGRTPCVDEEEDIALMIGPYAAHYSDREVGVFRESTGEFLYKLRVCGVAESIFMTDDRRAYVVANDGTLTLFNYVTGQILGLLHVGTTNNYRAWAWDRLAKRILCIEATPDILPLGTCTLKVKGYYPIPVAHNLLGPIPLQAPAVGRRVEMITKVYGAVGEGVPGALVNYELGSMTGATLSPAQHATDLNGNSRTFVTYTLVGDKSITAEVEA